MQKTSNYSLNKPESADPIRVADFNENADIIDAALAETPKLIAGTYTGDSSETRIIELGFTPQAIYVCNYRGETSYNSATGSLLIFGGLALPDNPIQYGSKSVLAIVDGGFQVTYYNGTSYFGNTNGNNVVYHYVALK